MARPIQIVFDAHDPGALARFWADALGYIEQPPPPDFDSWEDWARAMEIPPENWNDAAAIVDPDGEGPRVFIQKVPEGKTAKNRMHLDISIPKGADTDPAADSAGPSGRPAAQRVFNLHRGQRADQRCGHYRAKC